MTFDGPSKATRSGFRPASCCSSPRWSVPLRSATPGLSPRAARQPLSVGNATTLTPSAANTGLDEVHARISEFARGCRLARPVHSAALKRLLYGSQLPHHKLRRGHQYEMDPTSSSPLSCAGTRAAPRGGRWTRRPPPAMTRACAQFTPRERAVKMGDFVAEIGHLPGSNGGAGAAIRTTRATPGSACLRLLVLRPGLQLHRGERAAETCPVALPLLVHGLPRAPGPSVAVRLIPNVCQPHGDSHQPEQPAAAVRADVVCRLCALGPTRPPSTSPG